MNKKDYGFPVFCLLLIVLLVIAGYLVFFFVNGVRSQKPHHINYRNKR